MPEITVYPDGCAKIKLSFYHIDGANIVMDSPRLLHLRFTTAAFRLYRKALRDRSEGLEEGEQLLPMEMIAITLWAATQWDKSQRDLELEDIEQAIDYAVMAGEKFDEIATALGKVMGLSLPEGEVDAETQKKMIEKQVINLSARMGVL